MRCITTNLYARTGELSGLLWNLPNDASLALDEKMVAKI